MNSIKRINNLSLVRLFMRKLWQKYDHGGESEYRSLRCALLEGFTGLVKLPKLRSSADFWSQADLYEEIKLRNTVSQEDWNSTKLNSYLQMALISLGGLRRWFDLDLIREGDASTYTHHWDMTWVNASAAIIPVPQLSHIDDEKKLKGIAIMARSLTLLRIQRLRDQYLA